MSISITRYVNITSGVGGAATFGARDLILRIFTANPAVPPKSVLTVDVIEDMLKLFAENSDEYKIGVKYLGFVSKLITRPQRLSIVRWTKTAAAPMIFGDMDFVPSLTKLKAISAGKLDLVVDGVKKEITAIDLSAATDLAAVATALQTAIRTNADPMLANATVTLNTNASQFILTGATAGSEVVIECVPADASDVGSLLGWTSAGTVFASGAPAQTPVELLAENNDSDDNFGSFVFAGTEKPADADVIAVAEWNHAQNNKFMFCQVVTPQNAVAIQSAVKGFSGTALTLCDPFKLDEHPETIPAEICAATNFNRPNSSGNYMFYEYANRSAAVKTNAEADRFDKLRVNYIGETQSAGKKVAFYQRGFLQGDGRAAVDMNVYVGEMWLKSSLVADVMNLFLAIPNLPATDVGKIQTLGVMQGTLEKALVNGVFAPGKQLTNLQKSYIGQVTGNDNAWINVQNKGYFIDAQVVSYVGPADVTEYRLDYVLVYSANNQIRKVTGSDILI